jgi:hypothetical protein
MQPQHDGQQPEGNSSLCRESRRHGLLRRCDNEVKLVASRIVQAQQIR